MRQGPRPAIRLRGDSSAKLAFRAVLDQAHALSVPDLSIFDTSEPEFADVLEVTNFDRVIARAEEEISERNSQPPPPTDDASGPALPECDGDLRIERSAPILVLDERAFYHPAGRIDGFVGDPNARRLRALDARRRRLVWLVAGVLAPLVLLAVFVLATSVGRAAAMHGEASAPEAQTLPSPPR